MALGHRQYKTHEIKARERLSCFFFVFVYWANLLVIGTGPAEGKSGNRRGVLVTLDICSTVTVHPVIKGENI